MKTKKKSTNQVTEFTCTSCGNSEEHYGIFSADEMQVCSVCDGDMVVTG